MCPAEPKKNRKRKSEFRRSEKNQKSEIWNNQKNRKRKFLKYENKF
jgi:hypothetical protein